MRFELITSEAQLAQSIEAVREHRTIAKLDAVETGVQELIINGLVLGASGKDKYLTSWLAIDDDGGILGTVAIRLGERVKCWYPKTGFVTKLGSDRYGVNNMFLKAWEHGFSYAESHGYYELFYHQRIGRFKILEKSLREATFLKNYKIDIVETIEPFSKSKNPLVNQYMIGEAAGLNPKAQVLVRIYDPSKVTHEYPYA